VSFFRPAGRKNDTQELNIGGKRKSLLSIVAAAAPILPHSKPAAYV